MIKGDASEMTTHSGMRAIKYLSAFSTPLLGLFSFYVPGIGAWMLPMYVFLLVPTAELCMRPDSGNLSKAEEEVARKDRTYDWLLYVLVPIQFVLLWIFLHQITTAEATISETIGRTFSMGILCGVIGINVAHELGHRAVRHERILARLLLLTSLYMHFIIEHNRGHHRRVSTEADPASARYGEPLFLFWIRTVTGSYVSAWKLETERLHRQSIRTLSWRNEMIWNHMIQVGFLFTVWMVFDFRGLLLFLAAAVTGILLLETVNYIEHYGLTRKKLGEKYERVLPIHSWNSDHLIGRLLLFELSRHSDHHYEASRKYQILRSYEHSPQMPTGYPGMILLALISPMWFRVMHNQIRMLESDFQEAEIQS